MCPPHPPPFCGGPSTGAAGVRIPGSPDHSLWKGKLLLLFFFLCFPVSVLTVLLLGKVVAFLKAGSGSIATNLFLHSRVWAGATPDKTYSMFALFSLLVKDMAIYKRETTK